MGPEDLKIRIGKASSLLPLLDAVLGTGREEDVGLLWTTLFLRLRFHTFHVIASNLMLGAISAAMELAILHGSYAKGHSPLRECLIAADVSPLACFASLAALGMTSPRRASTLAGHHVQYEIKSVRMRVREEGSRIGVSNIAPRFSIDDKTLSMSILVA